MTTRRVLSFAVLMSSALMLTTPAAADDGMGPDSGTGGQIEFRRNDCPVRHDQLRDALQAARNQANGGFNLDMWATVVNRAGIVCAVAFSGDEPGDQWPGSRVISAQKANTANAFGLDGLALSTANLFSATQSWQSLYGLQESNPVNTDLAYRGPFRLYGSRNDPMVGGRIGGVNVFGGGLGLYNDTGIIGGLGVSGDSSCADHNIAWRVRAALGLDQTPNKDGIVYDITYPTVPPAAEPFSAGGFGHPTCGGTEQTVAEQIGATGFPS